MLLKSYLFTAVLYLPYQFFVCGWLYGTLLLFSLPLLHYIAISKQLEVFKKSDKPISLIVRKLFGKEASFIVDLIQMMVQTTIVIININIFIT